MEGYKKTIGRFGETMAKDFLIRRGYKILASNHRIGRLELDIIAQIGDHLIFIEVKTRVASSVGPAEDALKSSQIKDLKRAMSAYCQTRKKDLNKTRLDFIAIDIRPINSTAKIKHFKDIF